MGKKCSSYSLTSESLTSRFKKLLLKIIGSDKI